MAIDQVTKSPVGVSASASGKLARLTARTHGRVTRACGTAPTAMAELRRRADRLARAPLERNQLPSLVAAYRTWTDEVGGGAHARLLERKLELCDRVLGKVTVSYVVRSAPAAYGKDMWVDLVFDNATPKPMSATLSGVLEATGVYPAYAGTSFDKQTQAWRYDWGGSSADAVLAPPGRSTTRVGVVLGYLPMRSTGAIFNVQPEVMLVAPTRGSPWCSVPVAEG